MSRCTIIKDCEIPGVEFNKTDYKIQDAIDRTCEIIEHWKGKLRALVCCTPKDMFNDDTFFEINKEFEDIYDVLSDAIADNVKLNLIELNKENIVNQYEEESKEEQEQGCGL